ncbi:MAG TPA: hypothetical protein VEA60_13090, partial [Allosphingosinicella sp.]|nr:hypothetical protein [Allosphingosinicella sp.]
MPQAKLFHDLQNALIERKLMKKKEFRELLPEDRIPEAVIRGISNLEGLPRALDSSLITASVVGEVDAGFISAALAALRRPRCAVPSKPKGNVQIQTFGSPGGRWSRGILTYSVNPQGCNLSAQTVLARIDAAFAAWQA